MLMIFDQECSFANHWKKEENKSELLELGAVVVDENYEIQSNFNSYVKSRAIRRVHGASG